MARTLWGLADGRSRVALSGERGVLTAAPWASSWQYQRARLLGEFSKHRLLTSSERYPSSIFGGFSSPVGSHQQTTCDSQRNDSHDDKKQCGDPLWGQPRGDARPVSSVDCLTLSHQAHSERSWGRCKRWEQFSGCGVPRESSLTTPLGSPNCISPCVGRSNTEFP